MYENITQSLREYKWYYVSELSIVITTIWFIFKLHKYNLVLYKIQESYANKLQQTMEIVAEPNYFNYLLGGVFFIALLIGFAIFIMKSTIQVCGIIFSSINFLLLIVLLVTFWNPVLATFAMLLIGCGLFILSNS